MGTDSGHSTHQGDEPALSVPERAFPDGPRPQIRLSRDPVAAAAELAEQMGGRTFAHAWAKALLGAAS